MVVAFSWVELVDASWAHPDHGPDTDVRRAFTDFGLNPELVRGAARTPAELIGYLEAHIEQGPYLESEDRSLGFVTAIVGARRFWLSIIGEAGTPEGRRIRTVGTPS